MNEILAYLAGVTDADGYIGIVKHINKKPGRNNTYHEIIRIKMKSNKALKVFDKFFKGHYYKEKRAYSGANMPMYVFEATDKSGAKIVKRLMPYLKVKQPQAKIIIRMRWHKGRNPKRKSFHKKRWLSNRTLKYREKLYKEIRGLNSGWAQQEKSSVAIQ